LASLKFASAAHARPGKQLRFAKTGPTGAALKLAIELTVEMGLMAQDLNLPRTGADSALLKPVSIRGGAFIHLQSFYGIAGYPSRAHAPARDAT
jgi:hypothetical protein